MMRPSSGWCSSCNGLRGSGRPLVAFDLGAVHDPSGAGIECVAPVHGAAIVPEHEIADAPDVLPGEFRPIDETPELVEQRLGLCKLEPDQISVAAAPEVEHAPAG